MEDYMNSWNSRAGPHLQHDSHLLRCHPLIRCKELKETVKPRTWKTTQSAGQKMMHMASLYCKAVVHMATWLMFVAAATSRSRFTSSVHGIANRFCSLWTNCASKYGMYVTSRQLQPENCVKLCWNRNPSCTRQSSLNKDIHSEVRLICRNWKCLISHKHLTVQKHNHSNAQTSKLTLPHLHRHWGLRPVQAA